MVIPFYTDHGIKNGLFSSDLDKAILYARTLFLVGMSIGWHCTGRYHRNHRYLDVDQFGEANFEEWQMEDTYYRSRIEKERRYNAEDRVHRLLNY